MMNYRVCFLAAIVATLLSGCIATINVPQEERSSAGDVRLDQDDPMLKRRQILLIGPVDQQAAELTIQKLLYLDSTNHEPIDLFLQTPGGEMKSAMAIEQIIRTLKSPLNTYALSECNSGGAMLLAAGTGKRRAFKNAVVVVHGMKIYGKPPRDYVERMQEGYTDFWKKKTHLPDAWLPLPHDSFHILTAEQALEYGIVDEVIGK